MIYYNSNTINNWNFGDGNIIKVYRNGAVCYYKITSGESPTPEYKVCFAVVDDISQYTDREFEDVYDNATVKWYKLNNLNQYEEYGVYGEGRNITYYKGKLTNDEGYEYEWNGSEWVNVGEVTGSTVTVNPNDPIPFEDSRIKTLIENKTSIQNITYAQASGYTSSFDRLNISGTLEGAKFNELRFFTNMTSFNYAAPFYNSSELTELMLPYTFTSTSFASIGECKKLNNLVVPSGYTSSNGADFIRYGYDLTNPVITFLGSPPNNYSRFIFDGTLYNITIQVPNDKVEEWRSFMNSNTSGGGNYVVGIDVDDYAYINDPYTIQSVIYPIYYTEMLAPPNYLTFDTMAEAQTYVKTNCVYTGMIATIGGVKYKFTYDEQYDTYQWSEITEDFTVNLNSQWQTSTSYGDILDVANYDFYQSFSNYNVNYGMATMFITINGYTSFTFKVRNYSESNYDYVVVNNLDDTTIPSWQPTEGSGTASNGKVYYTNKYKSSDTTWYDITFNNLDGGEHIITVTYGKDSIGNSYDDRGYVAIPKTQ